jgi:hypothetical protein
MPEIKLTQTRPKILHVMDIQHPRFTAVGWHPFLDLANNQTPHKPQTATLTHSSPTLTFHHFFPYHLRLPRPILKGTTHPTSVLGLQKDLVENLTRQMRDQMVDPKEMAKITETMEGTNLEAGNMLTNQ